jgi:hypothetical protein
MTPKRPRDPNQLAKSIIDIATGQKNLAPWIHARLAPHGAAELERPQSPPRWGCFDPEAGSSRDLARYCSRIGA